MDIKPAGAKLGISGTFEYRNAMGEIIKKVPFTGSVPLSDLGMTEAEAQTLINQQEPKNGTDVRE